MKRAVLALLLAAALLWYAAREPVRGPVAVPSVAPVVAHAAPPPVLDLDAGPAEPRVPSSPRRFDDPLATYRALSVYPPTSRPLTEHARDLIDWNRRHDRFRPSPHDPTVHLLLTADRYWLTGDEPAEARLEVQRDGEPLPVRGLHAHVEVAGEHHAVHFAGAAGQYVATLDPGAWPDDEPARARLHVAFEHDAGEERAAIDVMYTPAAATPARFTGRLRDTVEEGHLVVYAEIEVERPGLYLIDCNLYGADDTPVAWTRFKGQLDAGATEVPLRFFGKVLRDAPVGGPYAIGELRGARATPDRVPPIAQMAPYTGRYITTDHPREAFSDAEWESPRKQARLRKLAEVAMLPGAPRIGRAVE